MLRSQVASQDTLCFHLILKCISNAFSVTTSVWISPRHPLLIFSHSISLSWEQGFSTNTTDWSNPCYVWSERIKKAVAISIVIHVFYYNAAKAELLNVLVCCLSTRPTMIMYSVSRRSVGGLLLNTLQKQSDWMCFQIALERSKVDQLKMF